MKRLLLTFMMGALLTGCETLGLGDDKASIEDRNAQAQKKPQQSTQSGAQAGKGVETAGLNKGGIGAQSLEGSTLRDESLMTDERKNPSSPLSKRSVYFDYDSFDVKAEYQSMVEAHAAYLSRNRNARIILQGNADERGSREYNLALGQKRAESVRKAMSLMGVGDEQLEAVSFGEEKPRAVGTSEQDFAENRRADIVYGDE